MNLYSLIKGIPDKYGILKSYSIIVTFTDRDKAHAIFDEMKNHHGMEQYRDDSIIHTPTSVVFRILYHNAI